MQRYTVPETTVLGALHAAAVEGNFSHTVIEALPADRGYLRVVAIAGIAYSVPEDGQNTWAYRVNGAIGTAGAARQCLQNDDTVTFEYSHLLHIQGQALDTLTEHVTILENVTIDGVISRNDDLGTFSDALNATNLTGTNPYTVFAPDNMAFDDPGNQPVRQLLNNATLLSEILMFYAVQGMYTAADLMNMTQSDATWNTTLLQTRSGQNLTVTMQNGTLMIDNATVVQADINASNGIVHVIDAVLIPPGVNITAMAQNMTGNQSGTSPQSRY